MRSILEELWYGNIAPQSRREGRSPAYDEAFKMTCRHEETLQTMLSEKEKETFKKFCVCRDELDQCAEEDSFIAGFRLGARIVIESLCENDGVFSRIDV